MASINPPVCDFGWQAPHFSLPNFNDHMVALHAAKGKNGLLVMFICNHCPYVKAILPRLINDVRELQVLGVNTVAIMSNDASEYPEDSVENMQIIARVMDFPFPYLLDASQQVAKKYGAVCTPDFLVLTINCSCNIAAVLTKAAKKLHPIARATCSRR